MIVGQILSQIGPKLLMTWNITLIVYLEGTGGLSNKKLIDKKSWGWIHHFLAWKSRPSVPKRRFLGRTCCSLERGGGTTPSGGLRPSKPPVSEDFLNFGLRNVGVWARFWLKKLSVWPRFGGFLSERRPVWARLA